MVHFRDRRDAGRKLARELLQYANRADTIVLALPRGGVPVAYEVALDLNLPLDVFIVRKLGLPWQKELALGAIASGGIRVLNEDTLLIDDGLATGASMRAAVVALRLQNPKRIVVAVPIAAAETCEAFEQEVDEIICALTPEPFVGVGWWYEDFAQTTDEGVRLFLEDARRHRQLVSG